MKRLNFTFLFLFALLSFFSTNVWSQTTLPPVGGTICIEELNVTVDADCGWNAVITDFGATAKGDSIWVYPHDPNNAFTGSGAKFPAMFKAPTGKFPKGLYIYELYLNNQMTCWGHINVEHKRLPPVKTSKDTTDCLWYDANYKWPAFNLTTELAGGCYAWPVEGSAPRIAIAKTEKECDTITYVRTIEVDFQIEKKIVKHVMRRDTVCVFPLDKEEICWPKAEVELECDILPTDYSSKYDVSKKSDHDAISELLSPTKIAAYLKEKNKANAAFVDSCSAPYVKKDIKTDFDSIWRCLEQQKFTLIDSFELVKVTTHEGTEVWTQVNVAAYFCVKDTHYKVPTGTIKCENLPAPKTLTYDPTMTRTKAQLAANRMAMPLTPICKVKAVKMDMKQVTPLPKGTTCNIHVKCVDWVLEGECEKLPTIMRQWEIINWCDPAKSVWDTVQWVKVVDKTKPVITPIKDQWATIAPWTCAGAISVTAAVKDWSGYHLEVTTTDGVAKVTGNKVEVTGIWLANCPTTVTVKAIDWCGNFSSDTFLVYLKDETPPVAIAEDELNVSLTGEHSAGSDLGIAKVYKESFDAGSHDAGCGKVATCVLLKSELNAPIIVASTATAVRVIDTKANPGFTLDATTGFVFDAKGNQLYHQKGCTYDGEVSIITTEAKTPTTTKYKYVICKDYVKFCCEDDYAVTGNLIPVALVVSDFAGTNKCKAPDHVYKNNVSHSWTNVKVENKAGVTVECTQNTTITCDATKPYEEGAFAAAPKAWSICGQVELELAGDVVGDIDQCGNGEITRRWRIKGGDGSIICTQTIKGTGTSDFNPYTIKWPAHQDGTSWPGVRRECEPKKDAAGKTYDAVVEYAAPVKMGDAQECSGEAMGAPVWCNPYCTLVDANYEDDFDYSSSDVCKKIIRRWVIIDWCEWKPNSGGAADDSNDTDLDKFQAVDDTWITAAGKSVSAEKRNLDPCKDCEKPSGTGSDIFVRYTAVDRDGYYTYDQVIKIIDNTNPTLDAPEDWNVEISGGNDGKGGNDTSGCKGEETVPASAADMCQDTELDSETIQWWIERTGPEMKDGKPVVTTKSSRGADATMKTGVGTPGQTATIIWLAKDGCGNTARDTTKVTFEDIKNPTPVCITDLTTAVMNVGENSVTLWASDYDRGSFDNCTAVTLEIGLDDDDADFGPSVTLSCDNGDFTSNGTVNLRLYAIDAYGNKDYCLVVLRINDNNDPVRCPGPDAGPIASIAGTISTELGDMLESARVSLNKSNVDVTNVEGKYAFGNTPMYNTYEITAKKNDDFLNGVTTLDLVLIQKHVLGIEALNSPYKVIAADINSDTRITAADLVELRKLILGVYTEFPNNDSWRFVDATQTFADANDPFPFTEALTLTLNGNVTDQNFRGVKIGDASGSAIANSLIAAGTRSAGTLSLEISDMALNAGAVVTVPVRGANFSDIAAYQFTMDVRGLELTGVQSGAIVVSAENFAQLNANTITTAWNTTNAVNANDVLFTMTFRATASGQLSEALAISSRVTQSVAYTGDNSQLDVALSFNGVSANEFALFQNEPNPFDNVTKIGFQLAKSGAATLTVFDVTGKTVSVVKGEFNKGYNEILMNKSDFNASGVLYYQLESGEYTATKKMVVVE